MELHLKTLTPIWTGDHNAKCKSLKLTGLAGSIRWWYEAMIRGLGGWACDPTSKNTSCCYESLDDPLNKSEEKLDLMVSKGIIQEADRRKYSYKSGFYTLDKKELKPCVCEACKLFGCNGWAKTFRIRVITDDGLSQENHNEHDTKSGLIKINNNKGYMVPFGLEGEFKICITPISTRDPGAEKKIWVILLLALKYGALGAKTHLGYGVLKCQEEKSILLEDFDIETVLNAIVEDFSSNSVPVYLKDNVPVLTDFVFARLHPQSGKMPVRAPLQFRYEWRNELRDFCALGCKPQESYHLRHYFCGIIANPKCKGCHEFLEMQETKGLSIEEVIKRLKEIKQLYHHSFIESTVDEVVNKALKISDLNSIKNRFGIPPKKRMNEKEFVKYLKHRIPSYFCTMCDDKKINWEYKNEPATIFNGVKYSKIASHQFTSRIYKNEEDKMEMRAWAWFPTVLDKFFTDARQVARDTYIDFIKKKYAATPVDRVAGKGRVQWLIDLINN